VFHSRRTRALGRAAPGPAIGSGACQPRWRAFGAEDFLITTVGSGAWAARAGPPGNPACLLSPTEEIRPKVVCRHNFTWGQNVQDLASISAKRRDSALPFGVRVTMCSRRSFWRRSGIHQTAFNIHSASGLDTHSHLECGPTTDAILCAAPRSGFTMITSAGPVALALLPSVISLPSV
jgi:hypothetical protein